MPQLFLSSAGLKNIASLPLPRDYLFQVGSHQYYTSLPVAAFLSPPVARRVMEDISNKTTEIPINDDHRQFSQVLQLAQGMPLDVNESNLHYLLTIARKLQNSEMLGMLMAMQEPPLDIGNAVNRLLQKRLYEIDFSEEATFIANHFSEFEEIKTIPLDALEIILASPKLRVENESWLFNFIVSLVREFGNQYLRLLGYVYTEFLSESDMENFVILVEENDMTGAIWNSLKSRIKQPVLALSDEGERHIKKSALVRSYGDCGVFEHKEWHDFDGIISHLTQISGQNVHLAEAVEINSSSFGNTTPYRVVDYDNRGFFATANSPNSWIKFDFRERAVKLSGYSLRTRDGSMGDAHLAEWVIECSNDGIRWTTIDTRERNDDLNNNNNFMYYDCRSEHAYRFIRIRQTGQNHRGDNTLVLRHIEFFGSLLVSNS